MKSKLEILEKDYPEKLKAGDRLARKSSELAIALAAAKEKADIFLKARTAP